MLRAIYTFIGHTKGRRDNGRSISTALWMLRRLRFNQLHETYRYNFWIAWMQWYCGLPHVCSSSLTCKHIVVVKIVKQEIKLLHPIDRLQQRCYGSHTTISAQVYKYLFYQSITDRNFPLGLLIVEMMKNKKNKSLLNSQHYFSRRNIDYMYIVHFTHLRKVSLNQRIISEIVM